MIKELLNLTEISDKLNIKNKIKINENFLLFLLKTEKKPAQILKNLNITKEELEKLIKKLPKNQKEEFLNIISKLNLNKIDKNETKIMPLETKTLNTNLSIKEKKIDYKKTKNDYEIITIEKLLNPNSTINIPKENETKIVNVIKKEIITLIKTKKLLLPENKIKKFKQISNLKELIEFSNKNGLNIKKIIYSKKEDITNILNQNLSNKTTSIVIKTINLPPKQKIVINHKIKHIENKQINHEIIKNLISKNTKDRQIEPTQINKNNLIDNIKKTDPKIDKKNENLENEIINVNSNQNIKHNIISAKQTLKHFANNLKEAIENYKPPIHKLNIELHPKELGKVEVTLIHRGENLQIQINSNQNPTINFFNQNQNELKTILVNMGYSEVNMSFNSNQHHQKQQQEYKNNQKNFNNKEEESFIIEIPYQYA